MAIWSAHAGRESRNAAQICAALPTMKSVDGVALAALVLLCSPAACKRMLERENVLEAACVVSQMQSIFILQILTVSAPW